MLAKDTSKTMASFALSRIASLEKVRFLYIDSVFRPIAAAASLIREGAAGNGSRSTT
jgi:hypothetical protein